MKIFKTLMAAMAMVMVSGAAMAQRANRVGDMFPINTYNDYVIDEDVDELMVGTYSYKIGRTENRIEVNPDGTFLRYSIYAGYLDFVTGDWTSTEKPGIYRFVKQDGTFFYFGFYRDFLLDEDGDMWNRED